LHIGKNLGSSSEGKDYAPALASYVINSPQLKRLYVRGSHGASNRHALWQLFLNLNQNNTLQELNIEFNSIGDRIFMSLTEALRANTGLKVIRLDGNDLTLTSYQALSSVISVNKSLQHVPFPSKDVENAAVGLNKQRASRLRDVLSNINYQLRTNRHGVEVVEDEELGLWEVPLFVEPLSRIPAHLEGEQYTVPVFQDEKRASGIFTESLSPDSSTAPSAPQEDKERSELFSMSTMRSSSITSPAVSSLMVSEEAPMTPPPAYAVTPTVPHAPAGQDTVIAIWSYTPADATELSFKAGDVIKVLERSDEGWWKGQVGASSGWFPGNYTEPNNVTSP